MNQFSPLQAYQQNITTFENQLVSLKGKSSRIAWLRLVVFVATIVAIRLTWGSDTWIVIGTTIAGIAIFLKLVAADADNKEEILNQERLLAISKAEVDILHHNFAARDAGTEFMPPHHLYAKDLDIFGPASLYQYINRCSSQQGKQLLAGHLLQPQPAGHIEMQQEAVKDLSQRPAWCQQLLSYGMAGAITAATEKKLIQWLQQPPVMAQLYWKWLAYIYPVISIGTIILFAADVISTPAFNFILVLFFAFSFSLVRYTHPVYVLLSKAVDEVNTLQRQLQHLENEQFNNRLIDGIKQQIKSNRAKTASQEILELKNILNRFDLRLNIFAFAVLNTLLLWDLRQMLALNKWKQKNGQALPHYFDAIAKLEVTASLATLAFNQPGWCYPSVTGEHLTFSGTGIGHPLIQENKRVYNNFAMQGAGKVVLVTGSNMGGKSTFLRSVGINTVLALAGSPVCAESFTVSHTQLMTSMRIEDNLAESTSTFYAELKKLETIIKAVNRGEKVFILLDEILRGTNSLDRHTGSKALIQQLIQHNATAIIATHDIELAKLQQNFPAAITNYHFDVQVANGELYFDYKLKEGICQSLNASILMKKIGIEM
ncbi:MutS-related protein [Foetidibacter luteolus]|uniref:MutS-related protein n=1 Tax=Foetidibacter luteolus TaxID=2608880 RepID=UPI00129A2C97|nr:MutS family DNA mismatch repair protein [Foetidibacter luteolus]